MKALSEKQALRKLKKIDQLKKQLRIEKQKYGVYDDSYGKRYSIAELFFELNEYKKTNRYLSWFNKTFPDDATYPHFKLGASYAFFQAKKHNECTEQLINLNSDNAYIINLITGIDIEHQNKNEYYEFNTRAWAIENLDSLKAHTDTAYIN